MADTLGSVSLRRFLALAARPLPRLAAAVNFVLAAVGVALVPAVIAIAKGPVWIAIATPLMVLLVLLGVAGLRLERRLDRMTDRAGVTERLVEFHAEGKHLLNDLWAEYEAIKSRGRLTNEAAHRADEWVGEIKEYMRATPTLGPSSVVRFKSDAGLEDVPSPYYLLGKPFWEVDLVAKQIYRRVLRLEELIQRLESEGRRTSVDWGRG